MPFVKGQSGNPAGRPRGCKNKVNREFDEKLLGKGEDLADKLFHHFNEGNATALRLVTQRLSPVTKGRSIEIDLPPLNSPADRPAAMEAIRVALCEGEITIDEASGLIGYVDKALGYDKTALAKGQLVALMREVVGLRSEVALMAARLDAELGPDNFKAESIREDGIADLGAAEARPVNIRENTGAASGEGGATDEGDVGDVVSESPAAIDQIKAESIAAGEPAAANGHANGQGDGVCSSIKKDLMVRSASASERVSNHADGLGHSGIRSSARFETGAFAPSSP